MPDVEAAAREAVSALWRISLRMYGNRLSSNGKGSERETVLRVPLTLAVTWFPASRIELSECASAGPVQIQGLSVGRFEFTLPARDVSAARPLGGDA